MKTKSLAVAALFALFGFGFGIASAQNYPSRPITVIAPFPPGGPSDSLARILSGPLEAALGQPIVIENVGGAGGTVGVGRAARAEPDGYTLLIGQWSTQVVNPVTYNVDYDIVNSFAPIALLANTPQMIIARKDFPAKNVQELIAWLKANPDKAQAGTVGAAGGAQVAGMYFEQVTGTKFGFVPYRGGAPAMQDLMAGRVDFMFDQAANAITQLGAGTIKAYAMLTEQRWHLAPEIPTLDEVRRTRSAHFLLACPVRAERHAAGHHCQDQRCGGDRASRSERTATVRPARAGHLAARPANAGSARRALQIGNRQVVADHQGRRSARGVS